MGILRFILAIAVVVYHSYKIFGLRMCGGQVAVESFYMISGFYMALIINEKYTGSNSYLKFLWSRFLRIFPTYWIMLFLAVLLSIIGYYFFNKPYYLGRYISYYSCLSWYQILWFSIENLIIIGQDVLYFTKLNDLCKLEFVYNPLSFKHNGFNYLFVPQAWTVSIELMFYIIAPFIVNRHIKWQLILFSGAILFRLYMVQMNYLNFDPWTYRFFSFELMFFIAGSITYQFFCFYRTKSVSKNVGNVLLLILILILFFYEEISLPLNTKNWMFFFILFLSIPFVFFSFKDYKFDRQIGELSFAIYISHHALVSVLRPYFFAHTNYIWSYGYAIVTGSILLALIFNYVIIRPLEVYRRKKVEYF
jgi:peptidoglycan/LPS O-acetylase OafA/YrhL